MKIGLSQINRANSEDKHGEDKFSYLLIKLLLDTYISSYILNRFIFLFKPFRKEK